MNNTKFLRGMGVGVAVGAAIGMACMPKSGMKRSPAGKAFKAVTDVMENIADAIGL
jgi:gas vesicle protein